MFHAWHPNGTAAIGRTCLGSSCEQGSALLFFHGEHQLSPFHEGSLVTAGFKHIIRSDVLYTESEEEGEEHSIEVNLGQLF